MGNGVLYQSVNKFEVSMCCFSGPVEDVANTRIFARRDDGTEYLVYEMRFSSQEDLAMVLPIPVNIGSGEDAVSFISLEDYPDFFHEMDNLFPAFMTLALSDDLGEAVQAAADVLEVHQVGCFDASFVPNQRDFFRLDPRFRLPDDIWNSVAEYANYGFVVFKLGKGRNQEVHPMAFSFPTRLKEDLFFPTVHVHDKTYHDTAVFDHTLYAQAPRDIAGWKKSEWALGVKPETDEPEWKWLAGHIKPEKWDKAAQLKVVKREEFCYRRKLNDTLKNADTFVSLNHFG